jgi:general secretion pathway protein G
MDIRGFTLIELLIVIAIISIIAAIAVPNLLTAIQKGKQKATMGEMKTIGTAIESYITEYKMAPGAGTFTLVSELENYLSPFYIKILSQKRDGWNEPFRYQSGAVGSNQEYYSIISYGRDRAPTPMNVSNNNYMVNTLDGFNNDICYSNGAFTYAPKIK